jgi:hypothetical protein
MTPLALQEFLVTEVATLLDGYKLKNEAGELVNISVFSQYLPKDDTGQTIEQFPYVRVVLKFGKDPDEIGPYQWIVDFVAGVWYKSVDCQGYRDAVNMLQKIYDHLMRQRIFDQRYEVGYPVKWKLIGDTWQLTDESKYPYFYVGLKTVWTIGKITVADILS